MHEDPCGVNIYWAPWGTWHPAMLDRAEHGLTCCVARCACRISRERSLRRRGVMAVVAGGAVAIVIVTVIVIVMVIVIVIIRVLDRVIVSVIVIVLIIVLLSLSVSLSLSSSL